MLVSRVQAPISLIQRALCGQRALLTLHALGAPLDRRTRFPCERNTSYLCKEHGSDDVIPIYDTRMSGYGL